MGATVYITGRKKETLYLTAKEIGESCRPIVCDHSDDSQGGFLQLIGQPIRVTGLRANGKALEYL